MKRVLTYLFAAGMMISAASLMFTSCTKEGPQGPAGANGTDGTDANATCTQCHNFSELIVAKIVQYDASQHAAATTLARNAVDCSPCHNSQGFQECLTTGEWETSEIIQNPAPINCRTCHKIHDTYTAADWELRTKASFTNCLGGTTDMTTDGGDASGNLCARCHQSRLATPEITDPTSTTTTLQPTSYRYGPHHGPQSPMLAGTGGYDINGDAVLANSYHTGRTSCVDCHGATASGFATGGHTLWANTAGCNIPACHDGAVTNFDYEGKQTIIEEGLVILEHKLALAGVLDTVAHPGYLVTTVAHTQKLLAIFYNYKFIEEDRSMGIHNFKRANGMIEDGITYLESLGY
ncbi:MAG: hypothetical protein IH596_04565 [Bacteroidales bacterium]|nr:hypothetical protein [Bacteroidales bacterium]